MVGSVPSRCAPGWSERVLKVHETAIRHPPTGFSIDSASVNSSLPLMDSPRVNMPSRLEATRGSGNRHLCRFVQRPESAGKTGSACHLAGQNRKRQVMLLIYRKKSCFFDNLVLDIINDEGRQLARRQQVKWLQVSASNADTAARCVLIAARMRSATSALRGLQPAQINPRAVCLDADHGVGRAANQQRVAARHAYRSQAAKKPDRCRR
jgi:hypothetical protein